MSAENNRIPQRDGLQLAEPRQTIAHRLPRGPAEVQWFINGGDWTKLSAAAAQELSRGCTAIWCWERTALASIATDRMTPSVGDGGQQTEQSAEPNGQDERGFERVVQYLSGLRRTDVAAIRALRPFALEAHVVGNALPDGRYQAEVPTSDHSDPYHPVFLFDSGDGDGGVMYLSGYRREDHVTGVASLVVYKPDTDPRTPVQLHLTTREGYPARVLTLPASDHNGSFPDLGVLGVDGRRDLRDLVRAYRDMMHVLTPYFQEVTGATVQEEQGVDDQFAEHGVSAET